MTNLFKKAESTSAYLKMGVLGFAGSGKTYTTAQTAIGLVQYMRENKLEAGAKPIFFLDTETGSDWVKPMIERSEIDLFTAKTRAFSDLMLAVNEAEKSASILIVDSISHFWKELCDSYAKRKKRHRGLEFQDWAYLKGEHGWGGFTDKFINSQLHVILCGRAGYEYDYFENDSGKKELEKTGIKMKAENEMGYEPSLLVLMERETDLETKKVNRTAYILKDRSTLLDGRALPNPTFESFLPHIKFLRLGAQQMGVDTSRNSEATIPQDAGRDNRRIQRRIALDEIQSLLTLHYPGQSADEKKTKISLLRKHFDASWTEMEEVMSLGLLRSGYDTLHIALESQPSKYHIAALAPAAAPEVELDDFGIPEIQPKPEIPEAAE